MIKQHFSSRNVLSDEKHFEECLKPFETPNFKFDLQLFGKGGEGKSRGKLIFSLVGFALGGIFWGALGASSWLGGAIMGASLFSSIWMATHKPKYKDPSQGDITIQRFDKTQETMSSTCSIPVVYGERKISGNQTYHNVNADLTQLHKHVVLCEGGIEGIVSVSANGLLIPTPGQTSNVVFTIRNNKYPDATVSLSDKKLTFSANGQSKTVELKNKDDMQSEESFNFWEYQCSVASLVSYINQHYKDGWECFPTASTNKYPGDLRMAGPGGAGGVSAGTPGSLCPTALHKHCGGWSSSRHWLPSQRPFHPPHRSQSSERSCRPSCRSCGRKGGRSDRAFPCKGC